MLATKLPALLLLPLLLGACAAPYSETPVPSNFLTSKQLKLQASEHWQVIANDVARKIADVYQTPTPIWIRPSSDGSLFNHVFRQQLSTALVKCGLTVLVEPSNSFYILDIQTQVLAFSENRIKTYANVTPAALATGVWSIDHANIYPFIARRDGNNHDSVALNEFYWHGSEFADGEVPQREIVLSINLTNKAQYIISDTRSYYISDRDDALYRPTLPMRNIPITGGN
jgi:hypothetical protein